MTIDLGSTSIKAVVFEPNGKLVSSASRPTEKIIPQENSSWVVWDPEQIWTGVCEASREALSTLDNKTNIRGIAVTGMGMDGIPVDEDGSPLYPFISWHDTRTNPQAKQWKESIGELNSYEITGFPAWHMMSVMRMQWMEKHHPKIMAKTYKWLFIEDYINFKLSNSMVTDYSMASCSLLFDQKKQEWSEELIAKSGINRNILPEVKPSSTFLGQITNEASKETGIPPGTSVYLGGHDHICSTIPLGGFKSDALIDILGTWESVMVTTQNPELSEDLLNSQICIESHVIPNYYVAWGGAVSGESVEWMRKLYKGYDNEQDFEWETIQEALESKASEKNGVIFLPYISGAACPVGDSQAKGSFVGLSNTTTKADMFKAVFEGLNFQFLDILKAFESSFNTKYNKIIVTGGGARNKFWLQNKADVSGLPVVKYDIEEATALGAAILAGIGAGVYKNADDAFCSIEKKETVIEPNSSLYPYLQSKYKIYQEVYPALKSINQDLSILEEEN